MISRRAVLHGMGVAAAASIGTSALAASPTVDKSGRRTSSAGAPWWLIAPLEVGTAVGRGWRIASLDAVADGAAVLTLSHHTGHPARVHICARQGRPRGLAHTALFDFVLMDGSAGDRPTEESLGRVCAQLARHIRRNELHSTDHNLGSVSRMQPHLQRVARYGAGALV